MIASDRQRLQIEAVNGVTIVHFLDRVISQVFGESNDVEMLGEQLERVIRERRPCRLLLDFAGVEIMISTMQVVLYRLQRDLGDAGAFKLCGMQESVARPFQITGMDKKFAIYSDVNAALNAFEHGR
jgi:anti-anti-sigma factor